MLVGIRDFAEAVGKSRAAVYKAIKDGRLFYAEKGMIDTDSKEAMSFAGANPSNTGGKYSAVKIGGAGVDNLSESDRAELEDERLRQQIVKLVLENNIKSEQYISRKLVFEKVIAPLEDLFIRIIADLPRTALLSMKESIGSGLDDGASEMELKKIFESHVKRTKLELSRGIKNA